MELQETINNDFSNIENAQKQQANKNNNFLVILLSCLVLLTSFIAGFFAYQTQSLVKELKSINKESKSVSNKPGSNNDWKVHDFETINLSLKAPSNFTVEFNEIDNSSMFTAYINGQNGDSGTIDDSYQLYILWQETDNLSTDEFRKAKEDMIIDSIEETLIDGRLVIKGQIKGERNRFVTHVLNNGQRISFFTSQPTLKNKELTDEILKTIKFSETNEKTTFCTMDAKICPDGSSVGRSGPKCEFDPCPTTSL